MGLKRLLRISAALFGALIAAPSLALAQATMPPKGQGTTSIAYQYVNVGDHLFSSDVIEDGNNLGNAFYFGDIFAQTVNLYADYGLAKNLAFSGGIALVASKYEGEFPESGTDDGQYHGSPQDISLNLRYQAFRSPAFFAPFVGVVIPSHNYETIGHASVGRNLLELNVGVGVARLLNPVLTDAFVAASYAYTVTEEVDGVGVDRSNVNVSLGYFVTRTLTISGDGSFQWGHEGIDWLTDIHDADDFHTHDRLAKTSYTRVGGSVAYEVFPTLDVALSGLVTLDGGNTHEARSIQVTTMWGFGGGE